MTFQSIKDKEKEGIKALSLARRPILYEIPSLDCLAEQKVLAPRWLHV